MGNAVVSFGIGLFVILLVLIGLVGVSWLIVTHPTLLLFAPVVAVCVLAYPLGELLRGREPQ